MTTRQASELLLEVLLLRARYSDAELKAVIEVLHDPLQDKVLAELLQALAALELPAPAKSSRRRNTLGLSRIVTSLEVTDPDKYRLLAPFELDLKQRQIMPQLADLRSFLTSLGEKDVQGRRREDLIRRVTQTLAGLPTKRSKEILNELHRSEPAASTEYQALARFILGDDESDESSKDVT